jgi:hypothetical protein
MRRIKVTFDLGGTWRLITTVQASQAITITAAKKAAIAAAKENLNSSLLPISSKDIVSTFAEVIQ